MSFISELFFADRAELATLDMHKGPGLSGLPALPLPGIESIMIVTLDEILTGVSFDDALDGMPMLQDAEGPGPWLFEMRQGLVDMLLRTSSMDAPGLADRWGDTEEIEALPEEKQTLAALIDEMRLFAQQAAERGARLYFWRSL